MASAGKIVAIASSGQQVTAGVQIYPPSATDPVSPAPSGGDIYYNTDIDELMLYDGTRGKWLASGIITIQAGRNGTTVAGAFYRGVDGMVLDASNRGIAVPDGTIVSIAWTRTDAGVATLGVLRNGSTVATLASAVAGATADDTVNVDVSAGIMSFRNQAGGANTSNVQVIVFMKRRA